MSLFLFAALVSSTVTQGGTFALARPDDATAVTTGASSGLSEHFSSLRSRTASALSGFVDPVHKVMHRARKALQKDTVEEGKDISGQQPPVGTSEVNPEESAESSENSKSQQTLPAAPLLIVPGILGSVLEAKRVNATWLPSTCMQNTEWYKTWFDLQAISFGFGCWSEVMRLKVSPDGTTEDRPGIHIRVMPDSIKAVSCYNPSCTFTCDNTVYLQEFFRFMTTEANANVGAAYRKNHTYAVENYELRKNLDAIPYDFRRSMRDIRTAFFPLLKSRIERMYAANGDQRVTVLGHSLGGLHTNLFFNTFVDAEWKSKYIRRFIPVSVAYGGSVKAMHGVLIGDTQGWPLPFSWTRSLLETWCGLYAAFPRINSKLWKDTAIMTVGDTSYGTKDIKKLFKDAGLSYIAKAFDALNSEHDYDSAPSVETHCLYSTGFTTMQSIHIDSFHDSDRDNRRLVEDMDGDGSVARKSMELCHQWREAQAEPVQTTVYDGIEHMPFMADNRPLWQQIFDITNFGLREGADYRMLRDE